MFLSLNNIVNTLVKSKIKMFVGSNIWYRQWANISWIPCSSSILLLWWRTLQPSVCIGSRQRSHYKWPFGNKPTKSVDIEQHIL